MSRFAFLLLACLIGCGGDDTETVRSPTPATPTEAPEPTPDALPDVEELAPARLCSADGWCWLNPYPQGAELRGAWSQGDHFVAVGNWGTALHYDGQRWRLPSTPVRLRLNAIAGTSPDDLVAVGLRGTILRYSGVRWERDESGSEVDLYDVWARASDDVWAVGDEGTLLHWDGSAWSADESCPLSGRVQVVTGSDELLVVTGRDGTAVRRDGTWQRYDEGGVDTSIVGGRVLVAGSYLNIHELMPDGSVEERGYGRKSTLAFHAWAESGELRFSSVGDWALIQELRGPEWSSQAIESRQKLYDVTGDASGPRWAVGSGGLVYRYGDDGWERAGGGSVQDLHGVWGTAPDDVFVVGNGGTILHWDGEVLVSMPVDGRPDLRAVWGTSSTNVFAVGRDAIVHYDGQSWSTHEHSGELRALHGTGPDDVWAVGASVVHWDGSTWTQVPSDARRTLGAVHAGSTDEVFAATTEELYRWNGERFVREQHEGGTRILPGMSRGSVLFAGFRSHGFYRGVDDRWVRVSSVGNVMYAHGLWWDGSGRMMTVGSESAIAYWDGLSWETVGEGYRVYWQGDGNALYGVWAHALGHAFAVGARGAILYRRAPLRVRAGVSDTEPEHVQNARAVVGHIREGRREARTGRWGAAQAAFEAALEIQEDDPLLLCEAGWAAFRAERLELAERHLRRGTRLCRAPGRRGACHYNLGRVLEARGESAEAAGQYRMSLSHRPNDVVRARLEALGVSEEDPGEMDVRCAGAERYATLTALCDALAEEVEAEDPGEGECGDPAAGHPMRDGTGTVVTVEISENSHVDHLGLAIQDARGWRFVAWLGTNESWNYDNVGEDVSIVDLTDAQILPGGPHEIFIELNHSEFDTSATMHAMWECDGEELDEDECAELLEATDEYHGSTRLRVVCADRGGRWACAMLHGPVPSASVLSEQLVCAPRSR